MHPILRRATFVLVSFLVLAGGLGAVPGGTYTVKGASMSTTQFDVHVSAADAQGNRTVSIADNGAIEASTIVSVTPNSKRVAKDDDCIRFKFKVETADGDTFDVELTGCSWELTNGNDDDQVGSYKSTGGTTSTVLFG